MKKNNKLHSYIGWIASIMATIMFLSYIDQIRLNIIGKKGSIFLPITTSINCIMWLMYAYTKEQKDNPLIICNLVGIVLSIATIVTAII